MPKPKIRWSAVLSAGVTAVGILSSPAVLALLPLKGAAIVTAIGGALQMLTKPAVRTEAERRAP